MKKKNLKQNNDDNNYDINNDNNEINNIELDGICKNNRLDKLYDFCIDCSLFIFKTLKFLFKVSGIYVLWICLHYFSAHLYVKFCVPNTIVGFIMSPFMIATPHCQGLRWIVYNAANIINNMWIIIGTWLYSVIWIIKTGNNENTNNI
jgi:hypothetical protein